MCVRECKTFDMNKRFSTTPLNLESVRRAKKRYNCEERKM
jgi:hypothetical protein